MALFTVDLDPELRAKLEGIRVGMGARSWAEVMRRLIDGYGGGGSAMAEPPRDPRPKAGKAEAAREMASRGLARAVVPSQPMAEPEVAKATIERSGLGVKLPVGHRKVVRHARDGKSGAALAVWGRLVRYDGDKAIYEEEA